jgi:RNA polymerase sigma-70 factor (ECF subfamily)
VEQAQRSDDAARREAFARYVLPEVDVLGRVAMTISARPADVEDLVQDTLLRAYKAIDRFDGAHPRAWLLTIMRHAHLNQHRRRRPALLDDPDAAFDRLARQAAEDADPEALVMAERFDEVVDRALTGLPDRFRRVVELVDVNGLSCGEAADVLGIPEGTVLSRLHRSRRRIRSRLAAAGAAPRGGRR